jgi:two-component system, OmpR family, phosphate regulon sensor histidine kinase PhoR
VPPGPPSRADDDWSSLVDRDLFIAVTSHELRTPVTVIKGFADTLVEHWDKLDPAGQRAAVRVISQRADELARLVDRLLAATTEPPGSPMHAPFDLVAALHEAVAELGDRLHLRLRVKLPASLPKAYGDRSSLDTVLTELITNATKYSSDTVDVSAAADDRTVGFQVADRGIGIAPEHVEQAFIRYWQADAGDRREHPGAGLGLYLVRQMVERQNGRVSLHPRDGGGTVAEVRLVRADVAVATDQPASEEE